MNRTATPTAPTTTSPATPGRTSSRTAGSARKTPARPARAPRSAKGTAKTSTARKAPAKAPGAVQKAKVEKVKKPKLVRDSYTIPKDEAAVLAQLKERSAALGQASKKSELLRAGIKALAGMGDKALLAALRAVPAIQTGRPKKG